ncbi:hypothetical protein F0L68_38770 [Solihabitans fulvus]|uniref:S1 motif domain-containing protein n=1 Tax=Solihabitans fulvus TaxID=1892852 RepID=A0A5B2WI98_9PSEU|nr:hypothetical protein [Solihabitans fulvus]KAA2250704.1 hypothetical protein F0L68_38770 [Solihabitans fulvus]
MDEAFKKGLIVNGVVVEHRNHGLLVRFSSGEFGVVDEMYVSDVSMAPTDWPPIGQTITVVSLGRTSGTRYRPSHLRLSARQSDIDITRGCEG